MRENGEAGFDPGRDPKGCAHFRSPHFLWNGRRQSGHWEYRFPLSPNQKDCIIALLGQLPVEAPKNPLRKPVLWGPLGKLPFERKRKDTSVASDSLRAIIRESLSDPRRKVPTGRRRGAKCDSSESQECLHVCGSLKEKRHNLNWNSSK